MAMDPSDAGNVDPGPDSTGVIQNLEADESQMNEILNEVLNEQSTVEQPAAVQPPVPMDVSVATPVKGDGDLRLTRVPFKAEDFKLDMINQRCLYSLSSEIIALPGLADGDYFEEIGVTPAGRPWCGAESKYIWLDELLTGVILNDQFGKRHYAKSTRSGEPDNSAAVVPPEPQYDASSLTELSDRFTSNESHVFGLPQRGGNIGEKDYCSC